MYLKKILKILSIFLTISYIVLLNGCSLFNEKEVDTQYEIVKPNIQIVQHPNKLELIPLKFYVVNESNYDEFTKKFLNDNPKLIYIALSIRDYENLTLNIYDIRRFITQQKDIILYYEKSINEKLKNEKNEKNEP